MNNACFGTLAASLALCVSLAGCGRREAGPPAPPVQVRTVTIRATRIPNVIELPGRIQAVRTAEVRARTDGIVQQRLYEEGSIVAAGTPLFQIDPRDNRAQVDQAVATLQRAEATRTNAASVVRRYQPLIRDRAVSAQEYDQARSDLAQAEAQVADARAALTRSRLLLGYTTIRASIAGRVGRAEVTEGALVSGSQATLMTRVDQISPVYAVFSQSSAATLDLMRQYHEGQLRVASIGAVTVRLILENGDAYPLVGRIDFADATVDPATGSQIIRTRFDNPHRVLAPGQFVRGRIEAGTIASGLVVPARAVQMKGEQASVSVVGRDDAVISRPVTLGALLGSGWVVRSGLKPGERVIVDGWQKVRPGQKAAPIAAAPGAQG